ncbi:MAG: hypothetical protein SNH73_04445 [Rikenellaceae bacterium]
MKRFFRCFVLTAVAAMGIVACSEGGAEKPTEEPSYGTTLTASVAPTAETKVSFTDNNTEGIDLAWESDDSFTIYDVSGDRVGDFI